MLVALKALLDHGACHGYALGAFNVSQMEQIQAVLEAADQVDSPVILQASMGGRRYGDDAFLRTLIRAGLHRYPHVPLVWHQDHGSSPQVCFSAIGQGFTSVMMDGSLKEDGKTPNSFWENVEVTKQVVQVAHPLGISVEGELGCLGSLETGQANQEDGHGFEGTLDKTALLTDPQEALEFIQHTQVDSLAIAIGTSHGAYKFRRPPDGHSLAMDRLADLHRLMPQVHFVLHGGSFIPENLQKDFRDYGGSLERTYGLPQEELKKAIGLGVRKVNVDTDLRMAATVAVRKILMSNPCTLDPRDYLGAARSAMTSLVRERLEFLGSAGMGERFRKEVSPKQRFFLM